MPFLAAVHPAIVAILVALFLFVCLLLILVVLIQRPAGGGLSGAFGSGAGSGQTAFGAKTGDALTIATITIFTVYLAFAVGLNFATRPGGPPPAVIDGGPVSPDEAPSQPAGAAPATPTGPAAPAPAEPTPSAPTPSEPAPAPGQPQPAEPPAPGPG
jgi:preprotein translocase subunit SecG